MILTASEAARFWAKVDKSDVSGCWLWTAAKYEDGYGSFYLRGAMRKTHRISLEMFLGRPIKSTHEVCHKCLNKNCLAPSHLYEGTHKENMRDRSADGTTASFPGVLNPKAKLNEAQILEIRRMCAAGAPLSAVVRSFGVTKSTASAIPRGRTWRHVASKAGA